MKCIEINLYTKINNNISINLFLENNYNENKIPSEIRTDGLLINVYFRAENDTHARTVHIHDENSLRVAIQVFMRNTGKVGRIKKAIYELNSKTLNLNSKLKDLNIDFSSNIIVYF